MTSQEQLPTDDQPARIFQDYVGTIRPDLQSFALYRATHPAPLLGGVECPAVGYTFAISTDDGATWRNPTIDENYELYDAVLATGHCCRDLGDDCPLRRDED